MEPNTPPYVTNSEIKASPLLSRIVLIALLLLLIGVVAYGIFYFSQRDQQSSSSVLFPAGTEIILSANAFPAINALKVTFPEGNIDPLTLVEQGTANILGSYRTDAYSYYLLSAEGLQTNVYRKDNAVADGGLTQLTNSVTRKADLTVDSVSGRIAFIAQNELDTAPRVIVWSADTGERDLGAGSRPVILPGGQYIVFERDNSLVVAELSTGTVRTLLAIGQNTPYVVRPDMTQIAIYEGGNIIHYSFSTMTEAVRITTMPYLGPVPELLFYSGSTLYGAHTELDRFVFSSREQSVSVSAPGLSLKSLTVRSFGQAIAQE